MTYPLIQQPAPLQQLAETMQAIRAQRQQQQNDALRMMLGQAQIANLNAETASREASIAAQPAETELRKAQAANFAADTDYRKAQADALRGPNRSQRTAAAMGTLTNTGATDPERVMAFADLLAANPELNPEAKDVLFTRYVNPNATKPVNLGSYRAFLSTWQAGLPAGRAARAAGIALPEGFTAGQVYQRWQGLTGPGANESVGDWLKRNDRPILQWTSPTRDPFDPTAPLQPGMSPDSALAQARRFFVARVGAEMQRPQANLTATQLATRGEALRRNLETRGLSAEEQATALRSAGWIR